MIDLIFSILNVFTFMWLFCVIQVGLRKGSKSFAEARTAGFTEETGTLGCTVYLTINTVYGHISIQWMSDAKSAII